MDSNRARSSSEASTNSTALSNELSNSLLETTITTIARERDSGQNNTLETVPPVETTTTTVEHLHSRGIDIVSEQDGSLRLYPVNKSPSKPSRLSKVKKTVTFEPRISSFDRTNPASASDAFRGFHTLFWILMAILMFRTFATSYKETGQLVTFRFGRLISEDMKVLAISDGVLVGATILCYPYILLVKNGWIRYRRYGVILQHFAQCLYLGLAIRWTFFRHWPWVQSGFLTLHSLTMLMKVHSYCATNGVLSEKALELKRIRKQLDEKLDSSPKGRIGELKEARKYLDSNAPPNSPSGSSSSVNDPFSSSHDGPKLTRRRSTAEESALSPADQAFLSSNQLLDILYFHPDSSISDLASDSLDLLDDLSSRGKNKVVWPNNLTLLNFLDYLSIPTLVYELEYPRTTSIRPLYVIEKTLATFGTFSLLYIITEHYIYPVTKEANSTFWGMALDLAAPFMVNYILLFYIIFECICNAFAELSRFADRQFYEDWWNSTSFDEFSRKWNKPVHTFLLRHVYGTTLKAYKLSKFQAAFVTFLLSACLHELVMAVVTKKLRLYLFAMQMAQLPLIMVGRAKIFKQNPGLGNLFFWIGLLSGFPLLAVGYLRF